MVNKVINVGNIGRDCAIVRAIDRYCSDSCAFLSKLASVAEGFLNRRKQTGPARRRQRPQTKVSTHQGTGTAPAGGTSGGGSDDSDDGGDGDGPGSTDRTAPPSLHSTPLPTLPVKSGSQPPDTSSPLPPPKARPSRRRSEHCESKTTLTIMDIVFAACLAVTVLIGFLATLQYDVSIALQIRDAFSLSIQARPANANRLDGKQS